MSIQGKSIISLAVSLALVLVAFAFTAGAAARDGNGPPIRQYEVTLKNMTRGQPFSPPVAATHHKKAVRLFQVGKLASLNLELIAEDGNQIPMFNQLKQLADGSDLLPASQRVTEAVNVGRPLTPSGTMVQIPGGPLVTDHATFDITGVPGDKLSLATMLICTNDGFLGLDAVELPQHGSSTFMLNGYDAGTENNTERLTDIVDPCSSPLGPIFIPRDGMNNNPSTDPPERIQHHPGITGNGDLDPNVYGWTNPVAMVKVTRMP